MQTRDVKDKVQITNSFETKSSFPFSKLNSSKEKYFLSIISLFLKGSISFLAIISLVKIGYAAKIRVIRLNEIKNTYYYEKKKHLKLADRFDDLFSFKGEQSFMKDQDQMISRDILRVIWR